MEIDFDLLHDQFVMKAQNLRDRFDVFEVMNGWLNDVSSFSKEDMATHDDMELELNRTLKSEQDTWQLILALYFYRLSQSENNGEGEENESLSMETSEDTIDPHNEKIGIALIEEKDKSIKELSIILQWLEENFGNQNEPDFTQKFISWEHTLEALKKNKLFGNYTSDKPMINEMDPDACHRQGKDVHAYDKSYDLKVQKGAYFYIRSGLLDKALTYLSESGYVAQAAMLRGAQPTEKVPLTPEINIEDKFRISGNLERDMWKNVAFSICESNGPPMYERACIGALCGHRKSLLDVAFTWEDRLYAYLRTLKDVRIEAELRRKTTANMIRMPEDYWAQDCSISESIEACTRDVAGIPSYKKIFCLVQKHVILDSIDNLLNDLGEEIEKIREEDLNSPIIGHQLRFLTHMLIVFGLVDLPYREELLNACAEAYVKVLVKVDKFYYIPYYVGKLSQNRQISLIAELVDHEKQFQAKDIEFFLKTAKINDLDILNIGVAIVEKLNSVQEDFDVTALMWITYCYESLKDPVVIATFIQTTLRIARKYLILNRISKAKQLMAQITSIHLREAANLSIIWEETIVRECLCYQAYLEAEDAFTFWQKSQSQRPHPERFSLESGMMMDEMSVSDQAFYERKRTEFLAAEEKWKKATNHHLKTCIEKYLAVLKFEGGWLIDCVSGTEVNDSDQIAAVRRILIPKVVFILLKLIKEHNSIHELKEFLYIICDDIYQILKQFKPIEVASIFQRIEEMIRSSNKILSQIPK